MVYVEAGFHLYFISTKLEQYMTIKAMTLVESVCAGKRQSTYILRMDMRITYISKSKRYLLRVQSINQIGLYSSLEPIFQREHRTSNCLLCTSGLRVLKSKVLRSEERNEHLSNGRSR